MTTSATPTVHLVLLGGDIGVYALARAFHEQYGTVSHVITRQISGPIANSRILRAQELGADASEDDLFRAALELGRTLSASRENSVPKPILLANADWLIGLIIRHRSELEEHYLLPTLTQEVLDAVSDKATFAQICADVDVAVPRTVVIDFSAEGPTDVPDVSELGWPVVAKASRSSAYTHVSFPGKRKVFEFSSQDELADLVRTLDSAGFKDRFVVQEMIPGDDTAMRSMTAYVDQSGRVTMLGGAHVLLEEHTPGALGNPAAMFTTDPGAPADHAIRFLEHTGYRGFANFDVKVDPRDGVAKFFEVNPRIGRNNYYMTAAGANVAVPIVADLIEGRQIDLLTPSREILYSIVPRPFLKRYIVDPQLRQRVKRIASAATVHPLHYPIEGVKRRAYVATAMANQVRKFLKHYPSPSHDGF